MLRHLHRSAHVTTLSGLALPPLTPAADAQLAEELQRARSRHIALTAALTRLEARVAAKEKLSDGLALIDFEQLRIENQTLAEKTEERGEELDRLRKKIHIMVQVRALGGRGTPVHCRRHGRDGGQQASWVLSMQVCMVTHQPSAASRQLHAVAEMHV